MSCDDFYYVMISLHPDDLSVPIPAHFLVGEPLNAIAEPNLAEVPQSRLFC